MTERRVQTTVVLCIAAAFAEPVYSQPSSTRQHLVPTSTFLRTDPGDDDATPPVPVDLAALGFTVGQELRLRSVGDFLFIPPSPALGTNAVAVFSDGTTVLSRSQRFRVPGAIQSAAPAHVTAPTFRQGLATDIPEDFLVDPNGVTVTIPATPSGGVPHLLLGADDVFWGDNVDPENDFAVMVENPAQSTCPPDTGQFLRLDPNEYTTIPTSPSNTFSYEELSLTAWIRVQPQPPGVGSESVATIVSRGEDSRTDLMSWTFGVARVQNKINTLEFEWEDATNRSRDENSMGIVADGMWHHVAVTRSNCILCNEIAFYIDGALDSNWGRQGVPAQSSRDISIGSTTLVPEGPVWVFDGDLDQVTIWSRKLDASEVAQLARRPPQPSSLGLVACWTFGNARGTQSVADSSVLANNGFLGSTPAVDPNDPERISSSCGTAPCIFRNGSGINQTGFNCTTYPVLGRSWNSTIAVTGSTLSTSLGLSGTPGQFPFLRGEILIGLAPAPAFVRVRAPIACPYRTSLP